MVLLSKVYAEHFNLLRTEQLATKGLKSVNVRTDLLKNADLLNQNLNSGAQYVYFERDLGFPVWIHSTRLLTALALGS